MKILTKDEYELKKERVIYDIKEGAIFIYPTDTIYGIGCNALDSGAVNKIRQLKNKSKAPFSVIAPSKEWILENCIINENAEEWIDKLPGPYTLIIPLKNKSCVAEEVLLGLDSIGIRIPDCWTSKIAKDLEMPIITTSVNKTGQAYMTSIEDLDADIKNNIDMIFDDGEKQGSPSTMIHLEKEELEIKERTKK
ncbi:L-threonylcarbamoyladenylate synthase [Nanoarchaeota archaeon]